jgi:hypothetical protein
MTAELQGYRRDRGGQDFVLRLKTVIVAEMVVRCSGRLLVLDWHFPCTSWCTAVVDASRTTEEVHTPPRWKRLRPPSESSGRRIETMPAGASDNEAIRPLREGTPNTQRRHAVVGGVPDPAIVSCLR